jgi:hypothetical protein
VILQIDRKMFLSKPLFLTGITLEYKSDSLNRQLPQFQCFRTIENFSGPIARGSSPPCFAQGKKPDRNPSANL